MSFLRSVVFLLWFAAVTMVMGTLALPLLLGPRKAALWLSQKWAAATLWGLKVFAGIGMRITGTVSKAPLLVAAKHMSTWDTLAIHLALGPPAAALHLWATGPGPVSARTYTASRPLAIS